MTLPVEMRGIDAKIKRAVENIHHLNADISKFLTDEPQPYRIVREVEEKGRAYAWKAFQDADVPLRFAVITGEVIHHLRSCFDHLIFAMVEKRGNTVGRQHGFPVTISPKQFKQASDRGMINGISAAARNLVESMQPYNTGYPVEDAFLTVLHKNDLADKHQLLVVVGSIAVLQSLEITLSGIDDTVPEGEQCQIHQRDSIRPLTRLTKEGEEVARTTFGRVHPNLDANAKFAANVAFEKFGSLDLHPVVPGLMQLAEYTATAMSMFVAEF